MWKQKLINLLRSLDKPQAHPVTYIGLLAVIVFAFYVIWVLE